jgi:large subunit ribosomal protein L10
VVLALRDKEAIVAEVSEVAAKALSLVAAKYHGLTVSQMTDLRSQAREKNIYLRVVRNTLARRALEGTEFSCAVDRLKGPLVLVFSREEPGAAARLVRDFASDNDALATEFVSIGGEVLEASALNSVAKLPSRDEALAILMSTMQAPITQLVRTLVEPHSKLVRTVAAVRDQKQEAA